MAKATPIRFLVSVLTQLRYMVMVGFTRLGLFKSAEEAAYLGELSNTNTSSNNYVLMSDGSSPSFVPVPVSIVTASIKQRLPVVEYSDFLERKGSIGVEGQDRRVDEEGKLSCSVCWDCVERSHQMRELSNCCHVFHRECLDRWVDEGQVTCPLCRSMLLPANTNPWVVLRNAHLSSTTTTTQQQQQQQQQQQHEQDLQIQSREGTTTT